MLKINLEDTNYRAKIVKLGESKKHSNADKLLCWNIDFQNVITDLSYNSGDIVVYFPVECAINKEFISFIDGFEDKTQNKNVEKKGFFNKHGRVRAIKLRGEASQGFVIPFKLFAEWIKETTGKTFNTDVGVEFDSFGEIVICKKYIPFTRERNTFNKQKQGVKRISRLVENQFRLHNDTENLRRTIDRFSPNDYVGIHYKKHGTSFVCGNVLTKKKLNWKDKVAKVLGVSVDDKVYDVVYSSRKVVKNEYETKDTKGFYDEDIWGIVKEEIKDKIPKGITLYGEICGFMPSGSSIQGEYDYGCQKGEHKTYIYRITLTNQDGQVFEFNDNQILEFCEKYQLNYKDTFIYYGKLKDLYPNLDVNNHWHEEIIKNLEKDYNNKDCYMSFNKVPEEGIVVRKEGLFFYEAYKLKSARFLEWETKELDKGQENIEDNQIVEENV